MAAADFLPVAFAAFVVAVFAAFEDLVAVVDEVDERPFLFAHEEGGSSSRSTTFSSTSIISSSSSSIDISRDLLELLAIAVLPEVSLDDMFETAVLLDSTGRETTSCSSSSSSLEDVTACRFEGRLLDA